MANPRRVHRLVLALALCLSAPWTAHASAGWISHLVGRPGFCGSQRLCSHDGWPESARLGGGLSGITDMKVRGDTLYIAEKDSSAIRGVDLATGFTYTYAGGDDCYAIGGHPFSTGLFCYPKAIAFDSIGDMYGK